MKKLRNTLIIVFTVLAVYSCDPMGMFEYWIGNNSDSEVYVVYSYSNSDEILCETIPKGKDFLLFNINTLSGMYDRGIDDLSLEFDSLAIFSDTLNRVLVNKDLNNRNEWSYQQEGTSKFTDAGYVYYTFLITNEHIVNLP